jgi:hypothetical protein
MNVDPLDLVDPERYALRGYPHETWTRLRGEAPVARIEAPRYKPFWAITKHADIMQIASQPLRFSSAQGITLAREGVRPVPPTEILVMIDPPRHGPMRRVVNARFTPRAVRARQDEVDRIAADIVHDADTPGAIRGGGFRGTHRRAVPARGDRLDPRGAEHRLGSCASAGPTRSSARTIRNTGGRASRPAKR